MFKSALLYAVGAAVVGFVGFLLVQLVKKAPVVGPLVSKVAP